MKAAVVRTYDAPPVYATFDDPVAQSGEQLVRVTAAGLHQIVKSVANGSHYTSAGVLPFVPGVDGTGRLQDGTRVYFGAVRSPFGSMAELAVAAPGVMLIPLPDGLDDAVAAGIANPAMSSWVALSARAKFVAGESVLILGATGTSGSLAVQIARLRGARRVVAVGRNAKTLEHLKALGADAVISLQQEYGALVAALREEINQNGVDVVLDYLWGSPAAALLEAIAKKGPGKSAPRVRYIQIGSMAGPTVELAAATLRSSGLELLGSGFGSASMDQIQLAITEFFALAAKEPFHFVIRRVPLSEVAAAWNAPEENERIVFQP
jgi:NADPH2:quinone reductase